MGEIPSANFHGNARGLARIASALANKGKFGDGRQLLSTETWQKMHDKATLALDMNLGKHVIPFDLIIHNFRNVDRASISCRIHYKGRA